MNAFIKPKPGTWNGYSFRSQLEIKWAKFFETLTNWCWEYDDAAWYDFDCSTLINNEEFVFTVEVKPIEHEICQRAIQRLLDNKDAWLQTSSKWLLVCGQPPSCYGNPPFILLKSFDTHIAFTAGAVDSSMHLVTRDSVANCAAFGIRRMDELTENPNRVQSIVSYALKGYSE